MNWYYMDGDKQIGPLTLEEIGALIEADKLTEDTLVWNETLTEWTRLIDSGLVETEARPSPTIKQPRQSAKSPILEHQYHAGRSPTKGKHFFVIISVTVLIVFGLIALLKFTAANKYDSSGLHQRTELKNETPLDDEGKLFDSTATSLHDDTTIPLDSRLDIFMKLLNVSARRTDGIYTAPFGFVSTSGLPSGFKDSLWGNSYEQARQRLGDDVEEVDIADGKRLTVKEKGRTISYIINDKTGLFRVLINYSPCKEDEVIAALVKQFGKVPKNNIVTGVEILPYGGESSYTLIHWLDDNTHIMLKSKFESSGRSNVPAIETLSITFETRYDFNCQWKQSLNSFLNTNIPMCGARPIFGELHWGITQAELLLLKDTKGRTTYAGFKPINFAEGICCLVSKNKAWNLTALVFDGVNGLGACSREFIPQTSRTAELVNTQLTMILGKGKPWKPQIILAGHDFIDAREWIPWNDILVRCVITKARKTGNVVTALTYGKLDLVSRFDPMTESARAIDKQYEF